MAFRQHLWKSLYIPVHTGGYNSVTAILRYRGTGPNLHQKTMKKFKPLRKMLSKNR